MAHNDTDTKALDGLFVDEQAAKIAELEAQGWKVCELGGDWIVRTPEKTWLGPDGRNQIWLFTSREIAWQQLIKAGA